MYLFGIITTWMYDNMLSMFSCLVLPLV